MTLNEVVIVGACRTPIGKFMGQFSEMGARDLAIIAGREAIRRAGIEPHQVDEIAIGGVSLCVGGGPVMASLWTTVI